MTNLFSFYSSLWRSWLGRGNLQTESALLPCEEFDNASDILLVAKGVFLYRAKFKKIGKMRAHPYPGNIFRGILFTQPLIWKWGTHIHGCHNNATVGPLAGVTTHVPRLNSTYSNTNSCLLECPPREDQCCNVGQWVMHYVLASIVFIIVFIIIVVFISYSVLSWGA